MKRPAAFLLLLLSAFVFTLAIRSAPDSPAAAKRFDAWKILGPGGGGAQFIPTVSPHDPKTVLVGCDMTGSYITRDGGDSWRIFNLRGRAAFFVFDPLDPKTIYARTSGLWRSTDSGRTWSLVYPSPASVTGVLMRDDHAGVRILTSAGSSPPVSALAVDPGDSRTLYAAFSERRQSASLQLSTDWGESWKKIADLSGGARAIYVDPHSPKTDRTLYVIGANSVAIRERGTWSKGLAPEGVDAFRDVSAGFPHGGGKLVVYAVAPGGLYISKDGGANWRRTNISLLRWGSWAPRLASIACSARRPEIAYLSYRNLREITGSYFGVAKTTDGGEHWRLVRKEAGQVAPNMKDLWISERFGPGWASNPIALGVAPGDPRICYTTDYGRTMRTTDGGETWYGVYSKKMPGGGYTTTGIDVTTCYGVHFDPFDSQRIFISYTDIGLFRSEDGGTSWVSSTAGVPRRWVNTTYWVEFDPEVKGRMWAVMSGIHDLPRPKMWRRQKPADYNGGVGISEDGGRTWRVPSESLPPTAATHILLDPTSPKDARVLYVAGFGRGVFKSNDGGKTWALKNQGIEGGEPFAWRLARDSDGALYVVVARRSDDGSYGNSADGALYRSTDGAGHWQKVRLPDGLNGPNGIAIDPKDTSRLYLAAWRRNTPEPAAQGGIFLSTDRGSTWRNVLSGDQHVYDVTIDPRNPKVLYAAGFESSAWRSIDRGETWERIKGFNFKWGHRVIPDPQDPKMIYITTFGGSVWYGPAQGDPHAVEDIVTPEMAAGRASLSRTRAGQRRSP